MTSLTHDRSTPLLDDQSLSGLLEELNLASSSLRGSTDVPEAVKRLVASLPKRMHADTPSRALTGDPYLAENAYAGAARAAAALLEASPDNEAIRELRLALEQVRQALRDLVEARPVDEDAPISEVAVWLEATFQLPQREVADLFDTSVRTWQRWLAGDARPNPDQSIRLRRTATLAMNLRHALTGPGAARWFTRQNPSIKNGGGSPIELLNDDDGYRRLLTLAAGMRSTQAS
jgi:hypothetical protein